MTAPRIVTLDIETAPIKAYVWGLFKQMVGLDQIIEDWSILSVSWKWLDEKEVHYEDTFERGAAKIRDDSQLLKTIWKVLDEADIVVSQYGKHFDIKKINARFIQAGMSPPSPYKQIDTKEEAAKVARFTSNKLAWLAKVVNGSEKDKHKEFPGFELWDECLKGNPRAWASMRKYNPKDVTETEELYLNLRPYIVGHPNVAAYNDEEVMQCPKCGSKKMQRRGHERTQAGLYQRFKCGSCGGWSRTRYTENTSGKRAVLLTN
jgi:predicted RNA-binding Zn-ribbon protein involved in translation (DUF1610 family)